MKTYVLLSRLVGATTKREELKTPLEIIIPIKRKNGIFKAPKKVDDYFAGFAFKKYLEGGETVLINPNGGWNILLKSDHILKLWQE